MNKAVDLGLLIIRLGTGGSILVFRAFSHLAGGSQVWAQNGSFIFETGLNVTPEVAGLTIAVVEVLAGLMIVTGALFRTGTILLIVAMLPSLLYQVSSTTGTAYVGLESAFVSILLITVLLGLAVSGPGIFAMHPFRRAHSSGSDEQLPTFENLT
ncbi:MAG: DoxX family protein [Rhodothermales bacterium]|nr:DoxX family protein [Rhodothermales bacterium]